MKFKDGGEEVQPIGQITIDNVPCFIIRLQTPIYVNGRLVRFCVHSVGEFERDRSADVEVVGDDNESKVA
jgi:hypothetical protein